MLNVDVSRFFVVGEEDPKVRNSAPTPLSGNQLNSDQPPWEVAHPGKLRTKRSFEIDRGVEESEVWWCWMMNDDDDANVGIDDGSVCSPRQIIYCWLSVAVATLVELLILLMLLHLSLSSLSFRGRHQCPRSVEGG